MTIDNFEAIQSPEVLPPYLTMFANSIYTYELPSSLIFESYSTYPKTDFKMVQYDQNKRTISIIAGSQYKNIFINIKLRDNNDQ